MYNSVFLKLKSKQLTDTAFIKEASDHKVHSANGSQIEKNSPKFSSRGEIILFAQSSLFRRSFHFRYSRQPSLLRINDSLNKQHFNSFLGFQPPDNEQFAELLISPTPSRFQCAHSLQNRKLVKKKVVCPLKRQLSVI